MALKRPTESRNTEPPSWAVDAVQELLRHTKWTVGTAPAGATSPDLLITREKQRYAVEVKMSSEGRADRLVPLWAQAYLQVRRAAPDWPALVIVAAPSISDRVALHVAEFARQNAPGAAFGVIDRQGRRYFEGEGLEKLKSEPEVQRATPRQTHSVRSKLFFSDVNQWLLKALLAVHLPEHLTLAPRREYRNASELARETNVSIMSAFRLVETLVAEGHLDRNERTLRIVRRRELLERWRAWSAARVSGELSAVFIISNDRSADLFGLLERAQQPCCLALFAAAEALGLAFVKGAPPSVYLPKLDAESVAALPGLTLAEQGESPHVLLREAPARRSVFRAAVQTRQGLATDVLQTWLDVSSHPTRGQEQADMIERRVLMPLMHDE